MAQPYLHEHLICVDAPATWLSGDSGQLTGGADGLYVADRRVLSRLVVTVNGRPPVPIGAWSTGAASARFVAVIRELGAGGPDPTVRCVRQRLVEPDGGTETITMVNETTEPVALDLAVEVATDFATIGAVKDGTAARLSTVEGSARAEDGMTVLVQADPPPTGSALRWAVSVPPRGSWSVELRVRRTDIGPVARKKRFSTLRVNAADRRLDGLVRTSVQDLDALRMQDGVDPFYAAGSPWYLTLFGRDSLWAARLGLPLGTDVAAGTLRALARRQGTRHDPDTDEAPGKILHELRPADAAHWLPPVYYGSIDATALFVTALAEAYRFGMPVAEVRPLLSNVERALGWLVGHDEFVAYQPTGHGLANQGWKDSEDGVQFADGTLAVAPLALCEVQGYAYQAAMEGAWLLETLGDTDGGPWRAWAAGLAARFRERFWCAGGYPAIALDGDGRAVDSLTSNIGHLLGTGLLDALESKRVADWLTAPELVSSYGLRTLSTASAGYNPISYHLGSVWPHDTAIAVLGLVRAGHGAAASSLISGLLAAAYRFDSRLPELYGGDDGPMPYPASCRPQAWAAVAGPVLVTVLLGLTVDLPAGWIRLEPMAPSPVGAFRVRGLRLGDGELDVSVDADGRPTVHRGPSGIEVR